MATLILAGSLIANAREEPLTKRTVRIENDRIVSIEKGFVAASSRDTVIDLSDRFVLPGLIDCHVHLTAEFGPQSKLLAVEESPTDIAFHAARHARVTLEAGFTTVRDLGEIGGAGDAIFALKKAVSLGYVAGPRILPQVPSSRPPAVMALPVVIAMM